MNVQNCPFTFHQPGKTAAGIEESIADGERIIIDEDGNATANILSEEVQRDFIITSPS